MTANTQFNSGFKDDGGTVDVGTKFVSKSYLMDIYPDLTPIGGIATPGLWVWGSNRIGGGLGTNDLVHRSTPVQTTAGGTNWKQVASGGYYNSAAIKTDGTLWTWGDNAQGALGTNDTTNRSTPVQTTAGGTNWKQVSNGLKASFVAAIKTDGTLWTWGTNIYGELGININGSYRSTPTQVTGSATNWKQVSCGYYQVAAIKTDGTLWTWGRNDFGQLGTNNNANRSTPTQIFGGGTNWKQVACGYATAAIKTDGTLWLWGYNTSGQLGTNDRVHRSTPTQVAGGGTNWKQVSCGYIYVGAIKTDGTLWTWGDNYYGQLGINDAVQTKRSTPTQISGGGTNWKQVSCGFVNSSATKTDGTLWSWGFNANGEAGTNNTVLNSTPVQTIFSGNYWVKVSCGYEDTKAIKEMGDLF
jgi:alpha-tubulin suppressor-like RCC1 family protein